jgi:hypothetical protein
MNMASEGSPGRPALVVVACHRPAALQRLLASLLRLDTGPVGPQARIPLVLSLDGEHPAVARIARRFEWPHGEKRIITHKDRLGVREHVLTCGDLSGEYGAVMVLEDDLYLSEGAYRFAALGIAAYQDDPRIAGVSLYSHRRTEVSGFAFTPLMDEYDTFFLRFPSSRGQVWTAPQWQAFRAWYDRHASQGVTLAHRVPAGVVRWKDSSWKKYFLRYLIESDHWFVYPRRSLSTNCSEPGAHTPEMRVTNAITPLDTSLRDWRFASLDKGVRYDAWFEPDADMLKRLFPRLEGTDFSVNLRSEKTDSEIHSAHMLSSRPCSKPVQSWPLTLLPLELNLQLDGQGQFFALGESDSFQQMPFRRWIDLVEFVNGESRASFCGGIIFRRTLHEIKQRTRKLLTRR